VKRKFLRLQEKRKAFEKFSNVKQLLWRKNKRRGFFKRKTLQRLWQINQNMNCFAHLI
jgi:hypothetical protein